MVNDQDKTPGAGSRIEMLRRRAHMTQVELAKALGITQPTTSALLADRQALTPRMARRVATLFGVSAGWLTFGEEGQAASSAFEDGRRAGIREAQLIYADAADRLDRAAHDAPAAAPEPPALTPEAAATAAQLFAMFQAMSGAPAHPAAGVPPRPPATPPGPPESRRRSG